MLVLLKERPIQYWVYATVPLVQRMGFSVLAIVKNCKRDNGAQQSVAFDFAVDVAGTEV